jgi:hypothetical protein
MPRRPAQPTGGTIATVSAVSPDANTITAQPPLDNVERGRLAIKGRPALPHRL